MSTSSDPLDWLDDPSNIRLVQAPDGRQIKQRIRVPQARWTKKAGDEHSKKKIEEMLDEGLHEMAVELARQIGIEIPPERLKAFQPAPAGHSNTAINVFQSTLAQSATAPATRIESDTAQSVTKKPSFSFPVFSEDEDGRDGFGRQPVASTSAVTLDTWIRQCGKTTKQTRMGNVTELPGALMVTRLVENAKKRKMTEDPKSKPLEKLAPKKIKKAKPMSLPKGRKLFVQCPLVIDLIQWVSANREALFEDPDEMDDTILYSSTSESEARPKIRRRSSVRRTSSDRPKANTLFKGLRFVCLTREGATRPTRETIALGDEATLIPNLIRCGGTISENFRMRNERIANTAKPQYTTHILCFSHAEKPKKWTMAEVLKELNLESEGVLFDQIDQDTREIAQQQVQVVLATWIGQCIYENCIVPVHEYEIPRAAEDRDYALRLREAELRDRLPQGRVDRNFIPTREREASSESESTEDDHSSQLQAQLSPSTLPPRSDLTAPIEPATQSPIELDADDEAFLTVVADMRNQEVCPASTEDIAKIHAMHDGVDDFLEIIEEARNVKEPAVSNDDGDYRRPAHNADLAEEMLEAPDVDRSAMYSDENMILSIRDQPDSEDSEQEVRPQIKGASPGKGNSRKQYTKRRDAAKYQCERPNERGARADGINEDICKILAQLKDRYDALPNKYWESIGMQRTIGILRNSAERIDSFEKAIQLRNVSESTAKKIAEIAKTGELRRLKMMVDPGDRTKWMFQNIYGVGPKLATFWVNKGLKTLTDVEQGHKFGISLSGSQKLGLKYYKDLLHRIPRAEVEQIFNVIKAACQPDCGDIDIILTRDDGDKKDHSGVLRVLCQSLLDLDLLKHTLSAPHDWDATDAKFMGLCSLPGGKMRHIDILCVPADELGAALIYFTGNDIFNRSLRLKARKMGYSLNQKGVFKNLLRDRASALKVTDGERIAGRTEQEIFDLLNVPYYPPHQRLP